MTLILFLSEILLLYFLSQSLNKKFFRLLFKLTRSKKLSVYIYSFIFFPGVFIHEISHFLFALFLLVPVGEVNLFPKLNDDEIQLGSVAIAKTDPFRRLIIGVSPIIVGISIILGLIYLSFTNNFFNQIWIMAIIGYTIFVIVNTCFSSKKDLEGSLIVIILITVFCTILYLLGVRISINLNSEILQKVSIFLSIPIVIDLIVILI